MALHLLAKNLSIVVISCHPQTGAMESDNAPCRVRPWSDKTMVLQPQQPVKPCREECEMNIAHCILQVDVIQVEDAAMSFLKVAP